jgi:hypothetical protein
LFAADPRGPSQTETFVAICFLFDRINRIDRIILFRLGFFHIVADLLFLWFADPAAACSSFRKTGTANYKKGAHPPEVAYLDILELCLGSAQAMSLAFVTSINFFLMATCHGSPWAKGWRANPEAENADRPSQPRRVSPFLGLRCPGATTKRKNSAR